MAVLNAVVIGSGGRAKAHLAVVSKLSNRYQLVGVCDIDGERARTVALEVGANAYTGLEEMLDKEAPDVGLIAVQAEDPLCHRPDSGRRTCADAMIRVAEENGVFLEVSEIPADGPTRG